jgi:hypothetical protein
MRTKIPTNRYGQFYLPVGFRKSLQIPEDKEGALEAVSNTRTVLLMPAGMKAKEALRSLDVIKKHLKHEEQIDEEEIVNGTTTN